MVMKEALRCDNLGSLRVYGEFLELLELRGGRSVRRVKGWGYECE